MPAPHPEPRVGSIYDHDGTRKRLVRPHHADHAIWVAQVVDRPDARSFIGREWIINHAPIELGPDVMGTTTVTPPPAVPAVAQAAVPTAPAPQPARPATPTRPTCPACREQYTGVLGVGHICQKIRERWCLGCHSITSRVLNLVNPPAHPNLCDRCINAGKKCCRGCGAVFSGRSRSLAVLCNSCNPLQDEYIWQHTRARGDDVIVETKSHRPFAVEVESFRMLDQATISTDEAWVPGVGWTRAADGSIRGDTGHDLKCEFRSPPFRGDGGLYALYSEVKKIRDAGYRANASCGLHVHVDAVDFKAEDLAALAKFGMWIQNDIYKFVAKSRSDSQYCRQLTGSGPTASDRYKWFNIKPSWDKHRTVEFRLHHGTTSPERTVEWVKVCLAIVEQGLRQGSGASRNVDVFTRLMLTQFQKDYWTSVSKSLHGARAVFDGARLQTT